MSDSEIEVAELLDGKSITLTEQSRLLDLLTEAMSSARDGKPTALTHNGTVFAAILGWPPDEYAEHAQETAEGQRAIYRTKSGRVLTETMIADLAAEAERGYEIEPVLTRIEAALNAEKLVSNLARVIFLLIRNGAITPADLGLPTAVGGWQDIADWLKS